MADLRQFPLGQGKFLGSTPKTAIVRQRNTVQTKGYLCRPEERNWRRQRNGIHLAADWQRNLGAAQRRPEFFVANELLTFLEPKDHRGLLALVACRQDQHAVPGRIGECGRRQPSPGLLRAHAAPGLRCSRRSPTAARRRGPQSPSRRRGDERGQGSTAPPFPCRYEKLRVKIFSGLALH